MQGSHKDGKTRKIGQGNGGGGGGDLFYLEKAGKGHGMFSQRTSEP